MRRLTLAFAIVSAILYCLALPLWEGFDEPFHYSYIETLANQHEFPSIGRTMVPPDVFRSLHLTPVSRFLTQSLPGTVSFEDWFGLTAQDRGQRKQELSNSQNWTICPASKVANYEAQQAPLAYLALLAPNFLLIRASLPVRILVLRVIGAISGTILLYSGCCLLARTLSLSNLFEVAALTCIFESQMLWASVAHVGNDWLAVPLTLFFLACLAAAAKTPTRIHAVLLAACFAAGLLTKAYFLAFVPVYLAFVFVQWRTFGPVLLLPLIASPWYARNLLLYRSIGGTQESAAGASVSQIVHAFFHINWSAGIFDFLRWSLWTGNWSFLSFSKITLNLELLLLLSAALLSVWMHRRISIAERWLSTAAGCFLLALVYQTCATWVNTNGNSSHPEPWYWQGVLPGLWLVLFSGLERSGKLGRYCAIALCLVSAWIAALTYTAKLLPWYGGLHGRANVRALWAWWTAGPSGNLSEIVLGPLPAIYAALACFLILLCVLTGRLIMRQYMA